MPYTWKEQNLFGDTDLLAAAGAAIAAFNLCEMGLISILSTIPFTSTEQWHAFVVNLNNADRLSLARAHLASCQDAEICKLYLTYLKHYGVCAQNRNLIAHAVYMRDFESEGHVLRRYANDKNTKKHLNVFDVDEPTMLEIADTCYHTYQFGCAVMLYAESKLGGRLHGVEALGLLAPLPEIPTLPNIVRQRPHTTPPTYPPPPTSSPE